MVGVVLITCTNLKNYLILKELVVFKNIYMVNQDLVNLTVKLQKIKEILMLFKVSLKIILQKYYQMVV